MKILIGSRAMNYWSGDIVKDSTDWDVISTEPVDSCEHHPVEFLNNHRFIDYVSNETVIGPNGVLLNICNPRGLAIIKRSHLHRSLSFAKHITHYHKKLVPMIGQFSEDDLVILNERTELTKKQFPFNHPKLNVTVSEFFDDYVVKKFDHDWLHEIVAYGNVPMYTRMQDGSDTAWCDKSKWDSFSELEKQQCVSEETLVISIERFLVPSEWVTPSKLAYMKSLEKVCTTLCSGWFRDYAIDNYPKIVDLFDETRIDEIHKTIERSQ